MPGKRSRIIAIAVSAFFATLLCLAYIYSTNPSLPQWEKEKVEEQYARLREWPLVWYDENGCIESEYVHRYIGTYGDCYAILEIGDNHDDGTYMELEMPYPIYGLSKTVYYPVEADVMLYHTKRTFENGNAKPIRFMFLKYIRNREEWISDEMLEQLTRDLEIIAKEHNNNPRPSLMW